MTDPTAAIFAALMTGVFLGALATFSSLVPRPPRKHRACTACGHDRGCGTQPRPLVDRDPQWDCADEADRMYPEDTP